MSQTDEDPALKELVTEALEKTGVLAAVRAHLRAGVFMALEREHDQHPTGPVHQLIATHDGLLALMLVQDLLDFCHLRHTASVYRAETGQPATFSYQGRDAVVNNFKLDKFSKNRNLPLLVQIISVLFSMLKSSPNMLKSNSESNVKETQVNNSDNYDTTFTSYSGSPTTPEENSRMSIQSVPGNNKSSEDDKTNNSEALNDTKVVESEKSTSDNDVSSDSRDSENISHPESALSNSSVTTKDAMELISESMSSQNDSNQSDKNQASIKTELTPNKNGINDDYINEHSQSCTSKNPSQCSNRTDLSNESIMEEIIPFEDNETSIISKLRASSDYSHTFSIDEALSMNSSRISRESSMDETIPETPLMEKKANKAKNKSSASDNDQVNFIESDSYKIEENSSNSFQLQDSSAKVSIPKNVNVSKKKLIHSQTNGLDQNT